MQEPENRLTSVLNVCAKTCYSYYASSVFCSILIMCAVQHKRVHFKSIRPILATLMCCFWSDIRVHLIHFLIVHTRNLNHILSII